MSKNRTKTRQSAVLLGMQKTPKTQNHNGNFDQDIAPDGAWSQYAQNDLRKRIEQIEKEAEIASTVHYQGIFEGRIPIMIPPCKIHDEIGSDRVGYNDPIKGPDTEWESFVSNIQTRGQRVPIRVRPIDPHWRPNPSTPRDITGQKFALQSGRRRLEACRTLGCDVLAVLSFSNANETKLNDLQERFFENETRKNLTLIQRLYSIGLICNEMPDQSQTQIANFLGVDPANISRGCRVHEFWDRITEIDDFVSINRARLDSLLKAWKDGHQISEKPNVSLPDLLFKKREIPNGTVKLSHSKSGNTIMKIETASLSDTKINKILDIINQD